MGSPKVNTAEGGSNTTVVTTANSGAGSGTAFDAVTFSGGAPTFSNVTPLIGALSYLHTYVTSQAGYRVWNFTPTATTTRTCWRFYFYLDAGQTFTSQDLFAVRSSAAAVMMIGINASSQLIVKNSAGTTVATAAATLSTATLYRVDVAVAVGTTTSNGTIQVSYYAGHSTTPIQAILSSTAQNTGTVAATLGRFGTAALVASGRTIRYDGEAVAELAAGFIGPASQNGDTSTPLTVTLASAASRATSTDATSPLTVALTADATRSMSGTTTTPVTVVLSADAVVTKTATATTAETVTLTASATRATTASASSAETVTLTAAATRSTTAGATSARTVALTATLSLNRTASATTVQTVTLTSNSTRTTYAPATTAMTIGLTAEATVTRAATVDTAVTVSLTADATVRTTAPVTYLMHISTRPGEHATIDATRLTASISTKRWEAHIDQDPT